MTMPITRPDTSPPWRLTTPPAPRDPAASTAPRTSRSWRVSTPSASGPACTSARPGWPGCTTSSGRSSTTPSTRRWPGTARASSSRCSPTAAAGSTTTAAASPSIRTRPGPHKGKSAAEVVLTVLHAGGKFGGNGYKVSGGLHGVGVSVVNALSERLLVEVDRGGQRYRQEYAKGGKPQGKMEVVGPTPARGRKTRHDGDVLAGPDGLRRRGHRVRRPHRARAAADDGVPQPRAWRSSSRTSARRRSRRSPTSTGAASSTSSSTSTRPRRRCSPRSASFEDVDEDDQALDIAIQWNTGYYEGIHGYANGISTTEGGMHVEGFRTALTTVVNKYARAKGAAQGEGREPARRGHPRGHHGDRRR